MFDLRGVLIAARPWRRGAGDAAKAETCARRNDLVADTLDDVDRRPCSD